MDRIRRWEDIRPWLVWIFQTSCRGRGAWETPQKCLFQEDINPKKGPVNKLSWLQTNKMKLRSGPSSPPPLNPINKHPSVSGEGFNLRISFFVSNQNHFRDLQTEHTLPVWQHRCDQSRSHVRVQVCEHAQYSAEHHGPHPGHAEHHGQPHRQHHGGSERGFLDPVQHHHPGCHHPGGGAAAGLRGRRLHVPGVPKPQTQRPFLDHWAERGQHQLQQLPRQHSQRWRLRFTGGWGEWSGAQWAAGTHHAGQLLQGVTPFKDPAAGIPPPSLV